MYSFMRAISSVFPFGERVSLIYMGFGLASSPILTWSWASSVGGSRCSKRVSHSMFRCLIQGSSSVSISSISSSFGSGWAETMLTETGPNRVPTLISELKDEVSEEWSYLANGLESMSDWSDVVLYPNPRLSFRLRELTTSNGALRPLPQFRPSLSSKRYPHRSIMPAIFGETHE